MLTKKTMGITTSMYTFRVGKIFTWQRLPHDNDYVTWQRLCHVTTTMSHDNDYVTWQRQCHVTYLVVVTPGDDLLASRTKYNGVLHLSSVTTFLVHEGWVVVHNTWEGLSCETQGKFFMGFVRMGIFHAWTALLQKYSTCQQKLLADMIHLKKNRQRIKRTRVQRNFAFVLNRSNFRCC